MPSMKKAQTAMEYLMIFGLVLGMVTPVWIYVTSLEKHAGNELFLSYAQIAADRIADTADLVYSQRPPAKLRVRIYMPDRVQSVNITGKTIIFTLLTDSGITDVYSVSRSDLRGALPSREGNYWVDVEAFDTYVNISLSSG